MSTPNKRLVIGLAGPVGSGVSTVTRILESHGFHPISMSAAIKQELLVQEKASDLATIPNLRQKLQDLGNLRRSTDISYWVDQGFKNAPEDKDIAIDGVRNLEEVEVLRSRHPNFYLIAIVATKDRRWERLKDQYKQVQGQFELDDQRDSDEDLPHGQQVQKCVLDADFVLFNDDNKLVSSAAREQNLADALLPQIALIRGTSPRHPTETEVHMATAYTQSQASWCLKRRVGAVIIDQNGVSLSMGFNENPVGMKPCKHLFGHCYKDENMHAKLELMRQVYCPRCGAVTPQLYDPWKCDKCGQSLKLTLFPSRNMEVCTAIHAEERAIKSLNGRSAEGATMYVTTFPCFQCARYVVDVKIWKVVYVEPYPVNSTVPLCWH